MLPTLLVNSCHDLINRGVDQLDMPVGIVSHIYNDLYEIVTINSEMDEFIQGAVFPLSNTYCRDVYRTDKTIAITEIDHVLGMQLHPLYVSLPVEAYISAPIHHNASVWGTVNFTSAKIRPAFTKTEIELVEQYAGTISKCLTEIDLVSRAPWDV
jgi:GAF domain-containing protein